MTAGRPVVAFRRGIAIVAVATASLVVGLLVARMFRATNHEPPGIPVPFATLPGFDDNDLIAAFHAFRASCAVETASARKIASREDRLGTRALRVICASMMSNAPASSDAIRTFFEQNFVPRKIESPAFFTGYYEPVVDGSLTATPAFPTPLYAPPADLVSVKPGTVRGLDPTLTAARKAPDGSLVALPDRASIEKGALGAAARPIAYVASPLDAFFIQVQGSARLRLPDGALRRLAYAGRNGYPYTAIGKLLVERLHVPASEMGMTQVKAWIRDNGQGDGDAGTKLMRENRSFIFFRFDDTLTSDAGPIGSEGVSLTPGRSLAIDHQIWPYGLPFYVDTRLADSTPFHRLMIGQDSGAAIRGPARADVFFGTGADAAHQAGTMRQSGTLFVLWPRGTGDEVSGSKTAAP